MTISNEQNLIQDFSDPLSAEGIKQAEFLAERLSRIPFDTLLSSDMERTKHTAEIIAKKTHHLPIYSPLFREVMYPTSLHRLSRLGDAKVLAYLEQKKVMRETDLNWKYEDEESVTEIMLRIHNAFDFAARQEVETVVVITHGQFLRLLLLLRLVGGDMPKYWEECNTLFSTSNTGISLFRKIEGKSLDWRLITWNDHAHLG